MSFTAAKCTNCGGELQLDDGLTTGYCMFCGSKVIVKDAIDLKKFQIDGKVSVEGVSDVENLMKRGAQNLKSKKYKEAGEFFQKVIDIDAENHEAWWGKHEAAFQSYTRYLPSFIWDNNRWKGQTDEKEFIDSAEWAIKYADKANKQVYETIFNKRKTVVESIWALNSTGLRKRLGGKIFLGIFIVSAIMAFIGGLASPAHPFFIITLIITIGSCLAMVSFFVGVKNIERDIKGLRSEIGIKRFR